MDFEYSTEERELQDLFARFFAQEVPTSVVRAAEPRGFDPALWDRLRRLDVPGLADDGVSPPAPVLQLAIIAEQAGYHLAPVPVVESFVALRFLAATAGTSGGPAAALLGPARTGEVVVTLALADLATRPEQIVPAGAVADHVVGVAGPAAVVLDRESDLVRGYRAVHGSAPVATWRWAGADRAGAAGRADGGDAAARHTHAVDEWRVLTAAALNGLARHALEIGAAYATERRAFGTPIGTFQGVAHPLAEHATALSGSELLTRKAAWALDQPDAATAGGPDRHQLAAMAFAFGAETAGRLTATAVHVHGGYGAALEYDIQLFHTRAKAWANVAGPPARAYAAIGRAQRRALTTTSA